MTATLNLDAIDWTPACPVLLPFGGVTIAPLLSASLGVFLPFVLFVLALFYNFYGVWRSNASGASSSWSTGFGGHRLGGAAGAAPFYHRVPTNDPAPPRRTFFRTTPRVVDDLEPGQDRRRMHFSSQIPQPPLDRLSAPNPNAYAYALGRGAFWGR